MYRSFFWITVVGLTLLIGCVTPSQKKYELHPSLQGVEHPPVISIKDFFNNRGETFGHRISPDGTKMAWIKMSVGRPKIHFKTIGETTVRRVNADGWRIYGFRWAQDSQRVFVNAPSKGKENYHIFSFDTKNTARKAFMVTKFQGQMTSEKVARIEKVIKNDPQHILVQMNDRNSEIFDLYKVNITNKVKTLVAENPGDVSDWITDDNGNLHARVRRDEDTGDGSIDILNPVDNSWKKVADLKLDDEFHALNLDAEKENFWALSNRNREFVSLVRFNLATGEEQLIYTHPKVDIRKAYISKLTSKPLLVVTEPDYPELTFLDQSMEKNFAPFLAEMEDKGYKGLKLLSYDNNETIFTLLAYSDKQYAYYFFDSKTGAVELLEEVIKQEHVERLSEIKPITIQSRDGLPLHGYLTLPKDIDPVNLPMVLLVHGGPWSRDYYGYDQEVQFLANRGYAVLQINFRGSRGYGRTFMAKAKGEFAGTMHNDLIDAVDWAIDKKIADKSRIAICGASYGGYSALVGLSVTPTVFACGIDSFGPTDLVALMESVPRWWKLSLPMFREYIGDIKKPDDAEMMKSKSPLYKTEAFERPVLIIYGSKDQRVSKEQSTKMIQALQDAGKQVQFQSFPSEGHWIRDDKNKMTYYQLIETFLARYLGGWQSS